MGTNWLRILRVKSDWRNRLSLKMINPEPAKNLCSNDKIRRLTASTHRISTMERHKCSDAEFADINIC